MQAGKLRHRVTLQQFTSVDDDCGQPIESWTDLATVWANVLFLNGKEYIAAGKEVSQATASIRIRKRDVTTSMRVIYDGATYDITAVLPGPKRDYLDLAVTAGVEA